MTHCLLTASSIHPCPGALAFHCLWRAEHARDMKDKENGILILAPELGIRELNCVSSSVLFSSFPPPQTAQFMAMATREQLPLAQVETESTCFPLWFRFGSWAERGPVTLSQERVPWVCRHKRMLQHCLTHSFAVRAALCRAGWLDALIT